MADLLVVGLGNPGPEYEHTRHNAGFDAVQVLAERHRVTLKGSGGKGLSGQARIGDKLLVLMFPGTYMNESGRPMEASIRRHGIDDLSKLVVLHDELDIEPGRIQVKFGGGLAGHNGLKSIKQHLKDDAFARVRIGIGRPAHERQSASDWVLRRPGSMDKAGIGDGIVRAADAVETVLTQGITSAMNRYN